MKRTLDIIAATLGLTFLAPILSCLAFAIWLQDRHSPFYISQRVGRGGNVFQMVKLRSMIAFADRAGIDSTSATDSRITPLGHFIRRYKMDELCQLWNVLRGEMSLVGPRPNVQWDTQRYTTEEKKLLTVRPGVTDLASIVFSDEGEILRDSSDPDLDYSRIIRPWKNRLGLIYIENQSFFLDLRVIYLTCIAIISKDRALQSVVKILIGFGADPLLIRMASRKEALLAYPPPGSNSIATTGKPADEGAAMPKRQCG